MTNKELMDLTRKSESLKRDGNGYVRVVGDIWDIIVEELEVLEIILNRCSPHKLNNSTYGQIEGIHFNIENHDDGYQKVKDLFMPIWRERASKLTQENYDTIQTNEDLTLLDSTKKLIAFYESKELNKNPFLKKELELSYLKAVQNKLEILEILKAHFKNPKFYHSFKVVKSESPRIHFVECKEEYILGGLYVVFSKEEKEKIEEWLENA